MVPGRVLPKVVVVLGVEGALAVAHRRLGLESPLSGLTLLPENLPAFMSVNKGGKTGLQKQGISSANETSEELQTGGGRPTGGCTSKCNVQIESSSRNQAGLPFYLVLPCVLMRRIC